MVTLSAEAALRREHEHCAMMTRTSSGAGLLVPDEALALSIVDYV